MREISAADAARQFKDLLDSVAAGETVAVTRRGERIATIVPAPRTNGAALVSVFSDWAGRAGVDDAFATRVREARELVTGDGDPWAD